MIDLIVVRHGETDWNRVRRLQGHTDVALNETGVEQASRLAAALRDEAVVAIHCSDLSRAIATALPVSTLLGLPIVEDCALRERNYGVLEGSTFVQIVERFPLEADRLRLRDADHAMPGGESQRSFHRRAIDAVTAIAALGERTSIERGVAASTVLVVTHGGVLDMLYRDAFAVPLDDERTWPLDNAVINRITFSDGRFTVREWAVAP